MKKWILVMAGMTVLGCAEKVQADRYPDLCRKRLDLANEASPVPKEDPVPPVEERHNRELEKLKSEQDQAVQTVREQKAAATGNLSGTAAWIAGRNFDLQRDGILADFREKARELRERQRPELQAAHRERDRFIAGETVIKQCARRFHIEEPRESRAECMNVAATLGAFDDCRDPFGTSYPDRCASRQLPLAQVKGESLKTLLQGCRPEVENMVVP